MTYIISYIASRSNSYFSRRYQSYTKVGAQVMATIFFVRIPPTENVKYTDEKTRNGQNVPIFNNTPTFCSSYLLRSLP